MLQVFINYDHDDPIMLINCIQQLYYHIKLPYKLFILTTEQLTQTLLDIQSLANCTYICNEQDYQNVLQDTYKLYIDYGTLLTRDITTLSPCYFYTNKLDYICKDNIIPDNYLYDTINDQTIDNFLKDPKDAYTHYDIHNTNCSATCFAEIAAIGKCEEDYLEEWINHHLQLGFSKIYFYDNNAKDNTKQKDICDKYPQVVYRDVRGWPIHSNIYNVIQMFVYNDAYYNNDCKYMMFIDIDEFLVFKNITLRDLIRFKKYIHINWQIYGDDDQIYKNDKPLVERFTTPIMVGDNKHIKSIVQTRNIVNFIHPHFCATDLICKTPNGHICNGLSPFVEPPEHGCAVLNHYVTKTAEEFIHKMNKGCANGIPKTVDFFFHVNKKTPEKINFFKSNKISV